MTKSLMEKILDLLEAEKGALPTEKMAALDAARAILSGDYSVIRIEGLNPTPR
jgi:hypothetical protein